MIRPIFIEIITLCLQETAAAQEFHKSNVFVDFFDFLSTEFAAGSKPPSNDNYRKGLILRRNNVIRERVESRSCDQGRRKNDSFTFLATVPICCLQ